MYTEWASERFNVSKLTSRFPKNAYRMMVNDSIAARIAELKAERSKRVQFTADDLFNELVTRSTRWT